MGKHAKTILWFLVIGFLLFYLVTNPVGAADAVRTVGSWLQSVFTFFANLAR